MEQQTDSTLSADEKSFAGLAHALQMPGFFIAPLIILIAKNESRFVRFHALNALLFQGIKVLGMVVFMILWFALIFGTVFTTVDPKKPPVAIFLVFPLFWLGFMGVYVVEISLTALFAVKAGRGEWRGYPILGRLAAKWALGDVAYAVSKQ
jgi:uncharacterized membrane protein